MPNDLPQDGLTEDRNMSLNSQTHQNLLAHAKKKAKKLFNLSKERNFLIEVKNLSEAKNIIAKINGYDTWHILEQVAAQSVIKSNTHQSYSDKEAFNQIYLEKFKRATNFTINDPQRDNIPYIIDEKNQTISSFIQIEYLGHKQYGTLLNLLKHAQSELQFMLDREFSTIEVDLFYLEDKDKNLNPIVFDPIDQKVNTLILNQEVFDLLKISSLEEAPISSDNYSLSIIVTIKTALLAQNEHFILIQNLQKAIPQHLKYSFISNHKNFKVYDELNKFNYRYSLDILTHNEKPSDKIFAANLKYLYNLQDKSIPWSLHIDKYASQVTIYSQEQETLDNIAYLLNGYKKEINKNVDMEMSKTIQEQSFKFKMIATNNMQISTGKRQTHIDVILGIPGSGKTTFAQKRILQNILNYTQEHNELPYLGLIDVGPSYKGLWDMLKSAVQPHQAHFIQSYTLEMTPEYSVNVFDTPLGCRYPSNTQKAFLTNFISLLVAPNPDKPIIEGMNALIVSLIENVYKHYADIGVPKRYDKNVNTRVDEALESIHATTNAKTTWWEVTDMLFEAQKLEEARLAQRYAVPLLIDLNICVRDEPIRSIYSRVNIDNSSEDLLQYFTRVMTNTINLYPILNYPTRFSVEGSKIVCIDLDKVARSGGMAAEHQSAIMYMVANHLITQAIHTNNHNTFDLFSQNRFLSKSYQNYHESLINENKGITKYIYIDELHRVLRHVYLKEQLIVQIRESRMWDIHLTLLAQSRELLKNETICSFISSLYILEPYYLNNSEIKEIQEIISSNILHLVKGDKQLKHAVYHMILNQYGKLEHFIENKISKELIWATNTTAKSFALRDELVKQVGFIKAIQLLIKHYPTGYLPRDLSDEEFNEIYKLLIDEASNQ